MQHLGFIETVPYKEIIENYQTNFKIHSKLISGKLG